MNGWSFLSTLVWATIAAALIWRAEIVVRAFLVVKHGEQKDPVNIPEIPNDLEAFASEESELYAQEAVREVIRARYVDLQDWDLVRKAVGIGAMP